MDRHEAVLSNRDRQRDAEGRKMAQSGVGLKKIDTIRLGTKRNRPKRGGKREV